jgi:2-dehydropantoate 2-reductase
VRTPLDNNQHTPETLTGHRSSLRVLSIGAGAIGTYIGGSLTLAGHTVVFIEKAEVVEELRKRGLRLEIDGQARQIPKPTLASTLDEALTYGPYDCAIFTLKSFDTRSALESIRSIRDAFPPILCLQNGVDNEPTIASILGEDKVIAATVTSAIGRRAAGDIILERLRGMGIAASHPLSARLVEAFNSAGLNARLFPAAVSMKWSKMLTNLPTNAASAILDLNPAEIFHHPRLFRLEIEQLREALVVMKALQIPVVDLPGTPVRLLAFAARSLPFWLSQYALQRAIGGGRGGKMPSLHIDLHSGRGRSEVTYLNGAVADYGERIGMPTPVNRFLNDTLLALMQGNLPLKTYSRQPDKLLDDLKRF